MSKTINKRVVVVLGMHRSGTSAIARSLELLGITLGENLHPASVDNPKGFWEDKEILAINEELLANLGFSYDRLGLVNLKILDSPTIKQLREKAKNLVSTKCNLGNSIWGFKDPRTARLLPFWKQVFAEAGCLPSYIIATRNPISIVESLRHRDGFEPEKTFYLWLEHLTPALTQTMGARRIIVDFDRLLENPKNETLRMARGLELTTPDPKAFADFEKGFLAKELRHTHFTTQDLIDYPSVPQQVVRCYEYLELLAQDKVQPEDGKATKVFEELAGELTSLLPALSYMGRQDQQLAKVKSLEAQASVLSAALQEIKAGRDWLLDQRDAWEKKAKEHEMEAQNLTASIEEVRASAAWMTGQRDVWEKLAREREAQLLAIQQSLANCDGREKEL